MIRTRTLNFWGFEEHPFADNILRGELLSLFVNREAELSSVEETLGETLGREDSCAAGRGMSAALPFPLVTADPAGRPLPSAVPEPPSPLVLSSRRGAKKEPGVQRGRRPFAGGGWGE